MLAPRKLVGKVFFVRQQPRFGDNEDRACWLVQGGHVAVGGQAWTTTGWTVIAAWTILLAVFARAAPRRDTERVQPLPSKD